MTDFLTYFVNNIGHIGQLFYNHIQYTFVAVLLAITIGVPLGITIYNTVKLRKPILSVANLVQAIPSLAILGFIVPYFGIGASTAIFMVVIYSLLPILKNTYTGLSSINPDTLEAAKGIGMTRWQILRKVQIPLALPVIMAGIRISSVTAVGLMTIAAYIGADVLGALVISGMQTLNNSMILSGAIPACVLALTMDFVMGKVEKAVTPISLQLTASNISPKAVAHMKRNQRFTIVTFSIALVLIVGMFIGTALAKPADIVVGSKDAVEGNIAGHIYAEAIEEKTDLTVERRMGLGGTAIAYAALETGEIDIYPDYTGTLLASVLGSTYTPGSTSQEVYDQVKFEIYQKSGITLADPSAANNTYILAVSQEVADTYNLSTISDLARVASKLKLGCTAEFAVRQDGLLGVEETYNLKFMDTINFTSTLMYPAIASGDVDVITAFATDSMVDKYGLVTLEDDLNFFPPYNLVAAVNQATVSANSEVLDILDELAPFMTNEVMRTLNGYVVEDGMEYETVARNFLLDIGYLD